MQISTDPNAFSNRFAADGSLWVKFYLHPQYNEDESIKTGRPIFEDIEYVQIAVPGGQNSLLKRPARASDKQRFAKQYGIFKSEEQERFIGTPLNAWPMVTPAQVAQLTAMNCHSVEQLSEMGDNFCLQLMGGLKLKERAKRWLNEAQSHAEAAQLQVALEERDARIQELEDKLNRILAAREAKKQAKAKVE